jgi:aerobic-type carbon monoxide dehydrogenase small subunit (CoxS/CutS family)
VDARAGEEIEITVTVNGDARRRRVEARKSLVDFLREDLELTGSHVGCEHGVCGACTVRVDGVLARGCLMLAAQCDGSAVETIEGVAASGTIADLQAAFAAANALQCGYCTPAMLLTADAMLREDPGLDADEIRRGLSGNCCRCTGYHAIVEAVLATARSRREARGG